MMSVMRGGWTETNLGNIADFYNGKAYKQDELLAEGKYRVLRVGNFFSNGNWYWSDLELDSNKYCDRGDLLYAWSASFGPRIWSEEKVIYHYHIWKVVEDALLVDKMFLYYWLEDDVQRMKQDAGTGSIMMHITKGEIEARTVLLPTLIEQKRIVDVVSSVDSYIDALQQQADTARSARNALLHELLSAGGDDWNNSTLGEIAHWQGGITPSMANNSFWENGTVPWISSGDVLQLNIRGAQKHVTEASLKETSLKLLPVGTVVVVVRSGILIHTLPVGILESPSTINQDIKGGVPHSDVSGQFLLWVLRSNSQMILESCRKTGTTVQSISTDAFLKVPVLLPPIDEQKRIVEIVSSMDDVIQSTEQAVVDAKSLRSGLLSNLLCGEHKIPMSYDSLLGAA